MKSIELADRVEETILKATEPGRTVDVYALVGDEYIEGWVRKISNREQDTIDEARSRIMGVGRDQYEDSDTVQKFEQRSIIDILGELRAEIIDQINWAVMLDIRIQQYEEILREMAKVQGPRINPDLSRTVFGEE